MKTCVHCESIAVPRRERYYPYRECGLSNVFLAGVEVLNCRACGQTSVRIQSVYRLHRAIAATLLKVPFRLTGEQFRFLRKHIAYSAKELARYFHVAPSAVEAWETAEVLDPAVDRFFRLLVPQLDRDLAPESGDIAQSLPNISNEPAIGVIRITVRGTPLD